MISSSVNHAPALTLQSVSRRFGGVEDIRDISIDIAYGERRVILGPNGAGKSTLFNLVAGEFKPSSGEGILFGGDISQTNTHYQARPRINPPYPNTHPFHSLSNLHNLHTPERRGG